MSPFQLASVVAGLFVGGAAFGVTLVAGAGRGPTRGNARAITSMLALLARRAHGLTTFDEKSASLSLSQVGCPSAVVGQYLVTLDKEVQRTSAARSAAGTGSGVPATDWAEGYLSANTRSGGTTADFSVVRTYTSAVVGAAVRATQGTLATILAYPLVSLVEVDCAVSLDDPAGDKIVDDPALASLASTLSGVQSNAWWGLDRIDSGGNDNTYNYGTATGAGVRVCALRGARTLRPFGPRTRLLVPPRAITCSLRCDAALPCLYLVRRARHRRAHLPRRFRWPCRRRLDGGKW